MLSPRETHHPNVPASFALMNLPRELRNLVYDYAIVPRAEFHHINEGFGVLTPPYYLSGLAAADMLDADRAPIDDPLASQPPYRYTREQQQKYATDQTCVLAYRLSLYTPLMLASHRLNTEICETLAFLIPRTHALIRSTIRRQHIVDPSPGFLNIWSCSHLILDTEIHYACYFLQLLPSKVRHCTRSLVITPKQTYSYLRSVPAAWTPREDTPNDFARLPTFFRRVLPNLTDCAIFVPSSDRGQNNYCEKAPGILCAMLSAKAFEVIRLLYRHGMDESSDPRSEQWRFLKNIDIVGGLGEDGKLSPLDAYEDFCEETDRLRTKSLLGVFEEPGMAGAETVIKITRSAHS